MKKVIALLMLTGLFFACKQTPKEVKEEAKVDSTVNTTIKSDQEKADSVLEYYQNKIDSAGEAVPEMPQQ